MITSAISLFFLNFVAIILSLLNEPLGNPTFPTSISSAMFWLENNITPWNFLFPIDTLFQIAFYIALVELGILIWKIGWFTFGLIRGSESFWHTGGSYGAPEDHSPIFRNYRNL